MQARCRKVKEWKEELKQWILNKGTTHSYPRRIAFVDPLPKNRTGKVRRFKLR